MVYENNNSFSVAWWEIVDNSGSQSLSPVSHLKAGTCSSQWQCQGHTSLGSVLEYCSGWGWVEGVMKVVKNKVQILTTVSLNPTWKRLVHRDILILLEMLRKVGKKTLEILIIPTTGQGKSLLGKRFTSLKNLHLSIIYFVCWMLRV